ncbi:MAG: molybdopterin-synthase adenylyltransferase MoeB [Candidatus Poseidoniaceae archaeon]|nr:molybdopterin-synthase adenylyltransferase MoeB [Candidatus Poseidoniaceae archaeon]
MAEQLSAADLQRFSRHLILPQVGVEGQTRIRAAKVAVIGAGGLGSPVILYLAAAGVGNLTVIDDDIVDVTNLQRQVLHDSQSIGRPKVDSARDRIEALDPDICVTTFNQRMTTDNALEILKGHDVVVDGSDNFPTRYLINDACEILDIPWIYGSIHRFEGQVSVFNHRGGPGYRDIFPRPPPPEMAPSCAEAGVLGVLPGVIGSLQANEVLKIIMDIGNVLSGILMLYDALEMRFRGLKVSKNPERSKAEVLLDIEEYCRDDCPAVAKDTSIASAIQRIEPMAVNERMDGGWKPYVIDVRTVGEASISSLHFVNELIPHIDLLSHLDDIPKNKDILLHCHHGQRSSMAAMILEKEGWDASRLFNMEGGIDLWSRQVDASIPRY